MDGSRARCGAESASPVEWRDHAKSSLKNQFVNAPCALKQAVRPPADTRFHNAFSDVVAPFPDASLPAAKAIAVKGGGGCVDTIPVHAAMAVSAAKGIMNAKQKNVVRGLVLVALIAWPGVETWRLMQAREQLAQSIDQERVVNDRLAYLQSIEVPTPPKENVSTVPVSTSGTQE